MLRDAFIYKKYTLCKSLDNLCCVFIHKKPDTLRCGFHGILKLVEGGGAFLYAKKNHFALYFYMQK